MTTTDTRPVTEQAQRECPDHWHCDPDLAPHSCHMPDRDRRCPTCGADPRYPGRAFIARRIDDAAESDAAGPLIVALNAILRAHRPVERYALGVVCDECNGPAPDEADPLCRSLQAIATAWHEHPEFEMRWWLS